MRIFLKANLPSHGMAHSAAYDGLETAQKSQLRAEEEREKPRAGHSNCSATKSRFEDEIIKKPDTAAEAIQLLDEEQTAVAFRHTPRKVPSATSTSSFFSNASLFRLLRRVNMDERCSMRSKTR